MTDLSMQGSSRQCNVTTGLCQSFQSSSMMEHCCIHVYGNYKVTINQLTKVDTYPLPRIADILASLGQGKSFIKLDLALTYLHTPFNKESRKYTVINIQKDLYKYNRLPFGVSSTPAFFKRTMKGILWDYSKLCVVIDDIIITGSSDQKHHRILDEVLVHLVNGGLKMKFTRCVLV